MILILLAIVFAGCRYSFIVPEEVTPPNPDGEPVSFSTQIQPIFDAKCIDCHKSGGQLPNLTSGNSYNQIVPAHVNTAKPEESDIYHFPSPSTSVHTWKKYSASEASLVLTWITEGTKNN